MEGRESNQTFDTLTLVEHTLVEHTLPESGMKVIACIGESLEERESNKTFDVVFEQVGSGGVGGRL